MKNIMDSKFQIYTVFPRWFCAGVDRAINLLKDVLEVYWAPVYVNHEIIHNTFIVSWFTKKWVIFEEDVTKIPSWSLVVVSAHWVWPSYYTSLRKLWLRYIDATCPLVTKVHLEALQFIKKGFHILYIGKKDHQEAQWVFDEDTNHITIVSSKEDVDVFFERFPSVQQWQSSLALLTQTTLSVDDTKELIDYIQQKYPSIVLPSASDICYATTNRQNAVKQLSQVVDVVFVIGSKSSSNSTKLKMTAEKLWKKAYLIDNADEIDLHWLQWVESIWVTSGASGPEELVQSVVTFLETQWWKFVQEIRVVEENMKFPYTLDIKN